MKHSPITRVAVIGAGTMGAGIAAHCLNAGLDVLLLDLPGPDEQPNAVAQTGRDGLLTRRPAALADPADYSRIRVGNLDEHLPLLAHCDLIIEAITEDLAIKRDLYARLAPHWADGTVLASNTSTFSLRDLSAEMRPDQQARFLILHFFNPPRYMRLIEVVKPAGLLPGLDGIVDDFCFKSLGKQPVYCADYPGFIANRLGGFWMLAAITAAVQYGIAPERADAILADAFQAPSTGIFGLIDLIGVDLLHQAISGLATALGPDDGMKAVVSGLDTLQPLIDKGYLGNKTRQGFYKHYKTDNGAVEKQVWDISTQVYRPTLAQGRKAIAAADLTPAEVQFRQQVLSQTLAYAGSLVPKVVPTATQVDSAMRFGYGWKQGPFELAASSGVNTAAVIAPQLVASDSDARDRGCLSVQVLRTGKTPRRQNSAAALWDMGDGVGLFQITTRMNTLDTQVLQLLDNVLSAPPPDMVAMVIGGDDANFSAGANLKHALTMMDGGQPQELLDLLALGQRIFLGLKYSTFPVIGACSGTVFGGGCELLMHCAGVQAHLDSTVGLVEARVGIIPSWGGTTQLLVRNLQAGLNPEMAAVQAFQRIATSYVAPSAPLAIRSRLLPPGTRVTMNRELLLADAKAYALDLLPAYVAPEPVVLRLDWDSIRMALDAELHTFCEQHADSPHGCRIAREVHRVLSGANASGGWVGAEGDLHALERAAVGKLMAHPDSQGRMRHMLTTGKVLKN